jgi:hypothetical protein
MKHTKLISLSLVFLLVFAILPDFQGVNTALASESEDWYEFEYDDIEEFYGNEILLNNNSDIDQIVELQFDNEEISNNELEEIISDEMNLEEVEELSLEVNEFTESNLVIDSTYETEEIVADFQIELEADNLDEVTLNGEVIEDGEVNSYDYTVEILDANEDEFRAIFIDSVTGEVFEYDSTLLNAHALPAIFVVIGGAVIRTVVKQVGKKLVINIGKRKFMQVAGKTVNSALKNYRAFSVKAGSYSINVSKSKMKHILQNHHPRYWKGNRKGRTHFDPDLSINNVKEIVNNGLKKNASTISKNIRAGKPSTITVKYRKTTYIIKVDNKGNLQTAYPKK